LVDYPVYKINLKITGFTLWLLFKTDLKKE
jgi:hypothetical protein